MTNQCIGLSLHVHVCVYHDIANKNSDSDVYNRSPRRKSKNIYNNIGIQMKRKELTKTFMIISN